MNEKTPRLYVSELKIQIEMIDARLHELEGKATGGAMDPRYLPEDAAEVKRLIARRKEIQNRIINYEP